jgi:predicted transcriptional regulator
MDVLRYVAEHSAVTVRDVANFLAETKGHTRTTALNVMERLREKGYLIRERSSDGDAYRYATMVPKTQLFADLVQDFVKESLGGSLQPFVAYLAREPENVSDADLAELKRLVGELEGQRGEEPQ